jgi:predicted Zn-dependent protease
LTAGPPPHEPPPTAFGHSPRRIWREVIGIAAGVALLGWLAVVGGRHLAGSLAQRLPYSVDQSLGAAASEMLLADADVCTNPVLVGAVRGIVERLAQGLEPEHRALHITVLGDDMVNAFALPGGHVFVMTGLLEQVESSEELAGVLGHELGHVVHRHGLRRIAESMWLQILLSAIFVDTGVAGQLAGHGAGLLSLQFGRDQERESDEFAVALLARAGVDPTRFAEFFARMDGQGPPAWLSTHPDPGERVDRLRESAAAATAREAAPLPPLADLKAPCHAR